MKKLQRLAVGVAMLTLATGAVAQTAADESTGASGSSSGVSSVSSGSGGPQDPFVACRTEIAEAKAAYEAGMITRQGYENRKNMAIEKLKASCSRSAAEKNLECN